MHEWRISFRYNNLLCRATVEASTIHQALKLIKPLLDNEYPNSKVVLVQPHRLWCWEPERETK